jgi:chemotaxis signal transduction protein
MRTFVRVTTADGDFALPVERVTEVRAADGMLPLMEPKDGVAGLLRRGSDTITVLSVLGSTGRHVVLAEAGDLAFGLLVSEVTGIQHVADDEVGPAPVGQERPTVNGVVSAGDELVLLLDVDVLARLLLT